MKTSKPLSVLMLTNMLPSEEAPYKGIFVREQSEQLEKHGHQVDLVDISTAGGGPSKYLRGRRLVQSAVKDSEYDVAHIHYGLTALSCVGVELPPAVITFHGGDLNDRFERPISQWASRRCQRSICVNPDMATRLPNESRGMVMPCGVPEDKFVGISEKDARKHLGLDPDRPYMLFPGGPEILRKNYDLFEQTLFKVREEIPEMGELKFGNVEPRDTPYYFRAANVTLLTSHSEGSPQVVKESIFAETPVVSVDVGDVASYLPQISGCFVTDYDAKNLAAAVITSIESAGRVDPTLIREQYGLESVTRKLEGVYLEAMKEAA